MENTTIQTVLKGLKMESFIDLFEKHDLEIELLKTMSEKELQSALKDVGISVGYQWKIIKKMQELKSKGNYKKLRIFEQ